MKKKLIILLVFITLFIYRQEIFNLLVKYREIKIVPEQQLTNSITKNEIDSFIKSYDWLGVEELNNLLLKYTKKTLKFGAKPSTNDINKFTKGTKTHCVGYAAFHNSILNYVFRSLNMEDYKATHERGIIRFLEINLNKLSNSAFYKNHDYIKIENTKTGKYFYCDPSLYEFTRIRYIGKIKFKK